MFGGDGCSPFVHRCEHKRSVVTMSAKFANVIPEYRLKRCNTILLSVFEGKESYEVLKSPMKFIMKSTKNFENQGYFCAKKGEYNVYETHLAGDEKFLNVLCGLKSCSAVIFVQDAHIKEGENGALVVRKENLKNCHVNLDRNHLP